MRKKLLTTDSTLCGYIIMPVVCTLYGYQDSALNHMTQLNHVLPLNPSKSWPAVGRVGSLSIRF